MRFSQRWLMAVLLVGLLVLSACGGATPEPSTDDGGQDVATEESAPAEEEEAAEEEAAPTDEAEEPTEEPEASATSAESSEGEDDAADDDMSEARTIDEIDSITSYRADISIMMEGEAFEADEEAMAMMGEGITISLAVVKDPPAQQVDMNVGPLGNIGFIVVDGQAYSGFGGEWFESSPDDAPDISELTAGLDAETVKDDIEEMERVGEEEVNGRNTIHYRGDRDTMAAMSDDEDGSLDEIEEGQIDLWIDEEEGFIVRMLFEGTGTGLNPDQPDLSGSLSMEMNYYDFNEEITIEVPEGATSLDDLGEDSFDLGGDPMEALGFELTDLPEGVTPEAFGSIVTFTLPDTTVEDVTAYIEELMAANGYELDEDASFPDSGIFSYAGDGTISAFLTQTAEDVDVMLTRE